MENLTQGSSPRRGPVRLPISLRTRLIAANILITAVSIAALGYYVYFRGEQTNAYLTNELDSSVRQKAVDTLTATGTSQASTLNEFFATVRKDITNVGVSTTIIAERQEQLNAGGYWNAATSLQRLPNGSWHNPATADPASIFVPAKYDLSDSLVSELNTFKHLDFVAGPILQSEPDTVAIYFGGASGETIYYPNIDLASLVPPDFDVTQRPWYVSAAPSQNPQGKAVWSAPYLDAARHGLVITASYPVYDAQRTLQGVVAMDVQLTRMSYLVSSIHAGSTGYAFVVDKEKRLIAMPDAGYKDLGISADTLPLGNVLDPNALSTPLPSGLVEVLNKMSAGQSGLETVSVNGQDRYVIFRPIPEVGYSLAIMVPTEEMLTGAAQARQQISMSATNTQQISFVLVAIILAFALLTTLGVGNTLISPLLSLTATADEITRGNLEARAPVRGRDEIATLGQTLNAMTTRLRDLIQSLEARVRDRTAALEVASTKATRRAAQFEAITEVTRAISSIHNMNELMPLVSSVISQYFGFYHVGIFLNDENNQNTWLIAANSEGGRRMLARSHNLKIGEQGIVGYVAGKGESRVARNVGEDVVYFNNPDLPETRSEAALPLRSGDRVSGVLDVQSTAPDAFSEEDLSILAILADQVSLAIENARLFETTRRSLTEAETLYRQFVHEAWSRLPREEQVSGYRYTPRGASAVSASAPASSVPEHPTEDKAGSAAPLEVSIKLRGEQIGRLVVQAPKRGSWTEDQIELVRAVAERVALSAENARLFDETSRRAERERLVTEITSRIRSTNDPDEMIQMALDELRNALGATEIQVIPQVVSTSPSSPSTPPPTPRQESALRSQGGNGAKK